jgi:peptide/nickel transport system substrate-binding protein
MNPLTTYSTEANEIISLVYDKLLVYDLDLKTQPGLAKEYNYSEDGKTLTLKLRNNVKWHDGKPLTADDVVYTYQLIKDSELSEYAQYLLQMTSIEAPDPATVTLTFDIPQAYNPGLSIPILPKHIWETMSVEDMKSSTTKNRSDRGLSNWPNGRAAAISFWNATRTSGARRPKPARSPSSFTETRT